MNGLWENVAKLLELCSAKVAGFCCNAGCFVFRNDSRIVYFLVGEYFLCYRRCFVSLHFIAAKQERRYRGYLSKDGSRIP